MSRAIKFRVAKKYNDNSWLECHGVENPNEEDYFVLFDVDEIYFDGKHSRGKCSIGSTVKNQGGDFDVCEEEFDTEVGDILQQYTGIQDKNGIEIYDGDILNVGVVGFRRGTFSVENAKTYCVELGKSKNYQAIHNYGSSGLLEVIGNIYENKDLLKNA